MGFPGGIVDDGESLEMAMNREFEEEVGQHAGVLFTESDYICSVPGNNGKLCCHMYRKMVDLMTFNQLMETSVKAHHYGTEVLGVFTPPLYTRHNGTGFPTFLKNQFPGPARLHFLITLIVSEIFSPEQLLEVASVCDEDDVADNISQAIEICTTLSNVNIH